MMGNFTEIFLDESAQKALRGAAIGSVIGLGLGAVLADVTGMGVVATLAAISAAVSGGALAGAYVAHEIDVYYKVLGLTPPPMVIRRLEDEESQAVFELSNVKIIDVEMIQEKITQDFSSGNSSSRPGYDFSQKPSYRVKIKLKRPDITFAELDYGNLEDNQDLEFIVTEDINGEARVVPEHERKRVLESLQLVPKFLGDQFYHPADIALAKMDEAHTYASRVLGQRVGGMIDRVYGWGKALVTGKTNRIEVKLENGPSSKIETDDYLDELVAVAVKTGKYVELLGHYEKLIINAYKTKLVIAEQNERAKRNTLRYIPSKLMLLGLGGVSLAFIGLAIAALFPPVSSAVATLILLGMSSVPSIVTAGASFLFIRKAVIDRKIANLKREQEAKDRELANKFMGLAVTREALQNFNLTSNQLNLAGKDLGDTCARVIIQWLGSKHGALCSVLNLANNNITDEGAIKLATMLTTNCTVAAIDLRRNPLTATGIESFNKALVQNFEVVIFEYDDLRVMVSTKHEIRKQLLINRYLKAPLGPDDLKKMQKYFRNEASLQEAARVKINGIVSLNSVRQLTIRNDLPELNRDLTQKQLTLIFAANQPQSLQLLVSYINIYKNIQEQDFASLVEQKTILALVKVALFQDQGHEPNVIVNDGLAALQGLSDATRTDLLSRCLAPALDAKHRWGIATLTSKLIGLREIFEAKQNTATIKALRTYIKNIFFADATKAWAFEQYIASLEDLRKKTLATDSTAALLIEDLLQEVMQQDLASRYPCLNQPCEPAELAALTEELNANFKLRSFKLREGTHPKIKELIESVQNRNNLHEALTINSKAAKSEKLMAFLKVYAKIPAEQASSIVKTLDVKVVLDLAKIGMEELDYEKLRELSEAHRIALFSHALKKDAPIDSSITGMATLLAKLIGAPEVSISTIRDEIFNQYLGFDRSFSECIDYLQTLRDTTTDNNFVAIIDKITQAAVQADLTYRFLTPGVQGSGCSMEELKEELNRNDYLIDSSFIEDKKNLNEEVREHIKYICIRNLLQKHLEAENLEEFFNLFATLSVAQGQQALLDLNKKRQLLHLINKQDLGDENALTCEKMRKLVQKRPEMGEMLLASCFSLNDSSEDAHKKARLVSSILKISDVFDVRKRQEFKSIRDLNYQIYWAISDKGGFLSNRGGKPFYPLKELKQLLEKSWQTILEDNQELQSVKIKISEILNNISEEKNLAYQQQAQGIADGLANVNRPEARK